MQLLVCVQSFCGLWHLVLYCTSVTLYFFLYQDFVSGNSGILLQAGLELLRMYSTMTCQHGGVFTAAGWKPCYHPGPSCTAWTPVSL